MKDVGSGREEGKGSGLGKKDGGEARTDKLMEARGITGGRELRVGKGT